MLVGWAANTLADIVMVGGAIAGIGTTIDKFVKKPTKKKIVDWCEDKWLKLSYISTLPFISNLPKKRFYVALLVSSILLYVIFLTALLYYRSVNNPEQFAKQIRYPDVLQYPICLSAASLIVAFMFGPIYRWIVQSTSGWLILVKSAGIWIISQIPGIIFVYGLQIGLWPSPNTNIEIMTSIGLIAMTLLVSLSLGLFFLLSIAIFVVVVYLAMVPVISVKFVLLWIAEYETGPVLGAAFLASGAAALAKLFI